jgi:hypothetical protein
MKAKASFVGGALIGLLVGSRIGHALYDRVRAGASAMARNPKIRRTASTASDRATHAAKSAGTTAAHQVKHASSTVAHRFTDRFNGVMHHSMHDGDGGTSDDRGL